MAHIRKIASAYVKALCMKTRNRGFVDYEADVVGGHSALYPNGRTVGDAFLGVMVTHLGDVENDAGMTNGVLFALSSGQIYALSCGVEYEDYDEDGDAVGEMLVCDSSVRLTLDPNMDLDLVRKVAAG